MTNQIYSESFTVALEDCISAIDFTLPNILGTYTIIKWMEIVCAKNINNQIDKNYITVGQKISIEHTGMVKLNEKVKITSSIQSKDKRNVSFKIKATSNDNVIAVASHERVIIPQKIIDRLFKK